MRNWTTGNLNHTLKILDFAYPPPKQKQNYKQLLVNYFNDFVSIKDLFD
jgi:hypothetical protein